MIDPVDIPTIIQWLQELAEERKSMIIEEGEDDLEDQESKVNHQNSPGK